MCSYAGPCSCQLCKTATFWWSTQCDSKAVAAALLRLGGAYPDPLLIKKQRRKHSLRICKIACRYPYTAFVVKKALEAAVLCRRKKRRTVFAAACFSRRSTCLFTTPRSCLHVSHSYGSQKGFSQCLQDPVKLIPSSWSVTVASVPCSSVQP